MSFAVTMIVLVAGALLLIGLRLQGIVYIGRTTGGWTTVHDDRQVMGERIRVLEVAGTYQSATYLDGRWAHLVFPYHQLFEHAFDDWASEREPASAAVLGGGGYALPKHLVAHHPELSRIDVVELDPAIEHIARRHFFLDRLEERYHARATGRLNLRLGDACQWLEGTNRRYDLIFNDCFLGLDPDETLMTSEGARLVRDHLTPEGIYLANVVSALEGPEAEALYTTIQALGQVFSHVWMYPCSPQSPGSRDNNVVMASNGTHRHPAAWEWPTTKEHDA